MRGTVDRGRWNFRTRGCRRDHAGPPQPSARRIMFTQTAANSPEIRSNGTARPIMSQGTHRRLNGGAEGRRRASTGGRLRVGRRPTSSHPDLPGGRDPGCHGSRRGSASRGTLRGRAHTRRHTGQTRARELVAGFGRAGPLARLPGDQRAQPDRSAAALPGRPARSRREARVATRRESASRSRSARPSRRPVEARAPNASSLPEHPPARRYRGGSTGCSDPTPRAPFSTCVTDPPEFKVYRSQ